MVKCLPSENQQKTNPEKIAAWIENTIKEFCQTCPDNNMKNGTDEPIIENPLVGFSNGADPLYDFLQKDIGPPQMTPHKFFQKAFPNTQAKPEELTVISVILPQTQKTKDDNRKETFYPSELWARAKHFGAQFAAKLNKHIVEVLSRAGYEAVAPSNSPLQVVGKSEKYGFASNWSERHAAYVSGLGTFGLCDGLITERGKAMVCRSVIAKITIPPTPRPYSNHHAYCLYYANNTCGVCIKRCPVEAISASGHDKERCYKHCFGIAKQYVKSHFGFDDYACGLCQTRVPCESKNPVQIKKIAVAEQNDIAKS